MIFEECPICFLYYPSLNRLRSCMKGVCTECFVQMNTPNSKRTYTRGVENYKGKQYFSEVLIQLMVRKRFWGIQIQMLHSTLIRNRRLIHWLISSSTKHLVLSHHQFLRYTIEASKARLNKCEGLPWIFSEAQTIREHIENVTSFHALSD